MKITHPVLIPASIELLVWVVLGSRRPLHNSRRPAERAQWLRLSHSTRTCRGRSARACRHLTSASACPFLSMTPARQRHTCPPPPLPLSWRRGRLRQMETSWLTRPSSGRLLAGPTRPKRGSGAPDVQTEFFSPQPVKTGPRYPLA